MSAEPPEALLCPSRREGAEDDARGEEGHAHPRPGRGAFHGERVWATAVCPPLRTWLRAHRPELAGKRIGFVASEKGSPPEKLKLAYETEFGDLAAFACLRESEAAAAKSAALAAFAKELGAVEEPGGTSEVPSPTSKLRARSFELGPRSSKLGPRSFELGPRSLKPGPRSSKLGPRSF